MMLTLVCMAGTRMCAVVFAVVRLNEPHAVKYGLCLNIDDKYRDLKKQLSVLCGVPASRLLLVEVYEKLVRVNLRFHNHNNNNHHHHHHHDNDLNIMIVFTDAGNPTEMGYESAC